MNITPARLTITIVAILLVAFAAQAVSYAEQRIAPIEAYVEEDKHVGRELVEEIKRLNASFDRLAIIVERQVAVTQVSQ